MKFQHRHTSTFFKTKWTERTGSSPRTVSAALQTLPDRDLIHTLTFYLTVGTRKHRTLFFPLFNICNVKYIHLSTEDGIESSVFLGFDVCSDAIFRIHPTALPKPQPPPALLGDSVAASPNPEAGLEAGLEVGVGGGVRDMWSSSLLVFQVKVRLEVGVASGVSGRAFMSSSLWSHRFRPDGRLVHRRRGVSLEKAHVGDNERMIQLEPCWLQITAQLKSSKAKIWAEEVLITLHTCQIPPPCSSTPVCKCLQPYHRAAEHLGSSGQA